MNMPKATQQTGLVGPLVILLIFAALIRLPALLQPWGADQAVYGYIGERILAGEVPYKDLYSSTGYGIFFTNSLAMFLFGKQMLSAHLLDALAYLLTVVVLYVFTFRLFSRGSAIIATALFILLMNGGAYSYLYEGFTAFGTYWYLCQRENFQVLLILISIWLVWSGEETNRPWLHLIAGILIGLAFIYKITAGLIFGFVGLYILFLRINNWRTSGSSREWMHLIYGWLAIPIGFVLAHLPFFYYFWSNDSLGTMLTAVFKHSKIYGTKLSRGHPIENLFSGHAAQFHEQFILWIFSGLAILGILRFRRERRYWLVLGWAVFSLGMVWMQKKFFGYHFMVMSAPLAVLAALGIRSIFAGNAEIRYPAPPSNAVKVLAAVLIIANLGIFGVMNARYFLVHARYLAGMMQKTEYEDLFAAYPKHMYSVPADREVAEFVQQHKQVGDALEIVNGGGEMLINFLSQVEPQSRFTSTWYLLVKELYNDDLTAKLRREFVQGIIDNKPAFVLFVMKDLNEYETADHADIRDFCEFMRQDYVLVKEFRDARYLYMPRERQP